MKILIVDDDEKRARLLSEYLCRTLPNDPAQVDLVTTAANARAALKAQHYDAMVLDVVIPNRDTSRPSEEHGMSLLSQLSRETFLKKPDRIIGITAHVESLGRFREQFESLCSVVIEAASPSDRWRLQIANALNYLQAARISRQQELKRIAVISIHGIRTYGTWQMRLRELVQAKIPGCAFYSYKYDYFSTIALLFPPARKREVAALTAATERMLEELQGRRIFIFAHSFGTYLIANALERLVHRSDEETELTVVLCGSVLRSDFDWSFLDGKKGVRIVNDCGDHDYVLWLSNGAALGLGMAGKSGFRGFNGTRVTNRYFQLTHSGYFTDLDFIPKYWLPLLAGHEWAQQEMDQRVARGPLHNFAESCVRLCAWLKPFAYLVAVSAILVGIGMCLG